MDDNMEINRTNDDKAVKVPSLLHSFGVIVLLLISITIFNATVRTILGTGTTSSHDRKPLNFIYDCDLGRNWTSLCPADQRIGNNVYKIKWSSSSCCNKTMHSWYIPWIRTWVWKKFDEITAERKRLKELEQKKSEQTENAQNETSDVLQKEQDSSTPKKVATEKEKEPPSDTVYTILTAMTLMLTIIALLEIFRDKFGKKPEEAKERRCSLADFTIKRHERKESQQQDNPLLRQAAFDEPKKVNELHHQGSLDRAISILTPAVKPSAKLPRQRSMPSRCPSMSSIDRPTLQTLRSIDLPEEEGSPAARRKSRHFIRRH